MGSSPDWEGANGIDPREIAAQAATASQILSEAGFPDRVGYLSSLLLLKRLSDRFDEVEEALTQGVPPDDMFNDRDGRGFLLPGSSHWSRLTSAPDEELGGALDEASRDIEVANAPRLNGVLTGTTWDDVSRLDDPSNHKRTIRSLMNHFGRAKLRDGDLAESGEVPGSVLGQAYDKFLASDFSEGSGKSVGDSYTPSTVARLTVELLQPAEGMRICDPTTGSGEMLISAVTYVQEQGGDPRSLVLHGQERHPEILSNARLRLMLHGLFSARLEEGDVIENPGLVDDFDDLISYDRVVGHPPFGLQNWGREFALSDPYERFNTYGAVPHGSRGELAFLLHMLAVTNPHGMVGVVMPQSILFRGGVDKDIRHGILNDDLFEAIIGLPHTLLYGASVPVAICILSKAKPVERRGKVLFIDATHERRSRRGRARNSLERKHMGRIIKAFRAYKDVDRFARVADMDEIERNDFNLTISQYVRTTEPIEVSSIEQALADLREAERRRDEAVSKMDAVLKEFGYG